MRRTFVSGLAPWLLVEFREQALPSHADIAAGLDPTVEPIKAVLSAIGQENKVCEVATGTLSGSKKIGRAARRRASRWSSSSVAASWLG